MRSTANRLHARHLSRLISRTPLPAQLHQENYIAFHSPLCWTSLPPLAITMPLTVMMSPTIVVSPAESMPQSRSRRAIALEHRRQNILTMRYRSSTSSLRETAAEQPEQTPPPVDIMREKSTKKRIPTARQALSCASYRLQSIDIDNWLKESMPLPPDYEHDPVPAPGLGIAMYGQQKQYEELEHIAPLNPLRLNPPSECTLSLSLNQHHCFL